MYQYPYGNAQQLNLDWILSKLQGIEAGASEVNIEEVANALVSASFDSGVSYRRYDYCFYNGKLYRALNDTTGAFNPSDWLEVVIGDDIPVLTRLLNAVDSSLTSLQNTVNELDSDDIDNASNVTGTSVSDALETLDTAITNLQDTVDDLDSDDVDNASNVTGTSVTAALDNLNGAITSETTARTNTDAAIENGLAIVANGDTHAAISSGQYVYIKGHGTLAEGIYKATAAIPLNGTLSTSNVATVPNGGLNDLQNISSSGYCKMPDGTMMQWGTVTKASGLAHVDVTMPQYFVDGNYTFVSNIQFMNNDASQVRLINNREDTHFVRIYTRQLTSGDFYTGENIIMWFAIGRWKA